MNKSFQLIGLICLIFNLSCAQNRNLVKNTPFTIKQSYFTSWVAQDSKRTSGNDVFISITNLPEDVELKELYFKGKHTELQNTDTKNLYKAQFYTSKRDYVVARDVNKEVNNPKPKINEEPPVEIEENEALLVYEKSGKTQYYILPQLQNKGTKYPAEAPFHENE